MARTIRATPEECLRPLPGDALIPAPIGTVTHAITIRRSARAVWPWLVQMGAGRAGWYSYDFLDNRGHRSARQILPQYQAIRVGTLMPALPGVTEGFLVLGFVPVDNLILGWGSPQDAQHSTWAFVLEQPEPQVTRLIVRARIGHGYRLFGLSPVLSRLPARLVHFIMQRKQLLELASRIERLPDIAA